jgi:hypothetical protein
MPLTIDDLKNWYFGITNPNHWANALNQLQQAKNSIGNFQQRVIPAGGSPIPGPPMTFEDVWKRLGAATNTRGKGATQPVNQSGY